MKYVLLSILVILASCSYSTFDEEWLGEVQLDKLTLSVSEAGSKEQNIELQLNDEEKETLKTWLKSFAGSHSDFNTYAPSVMLDGETWRVNFMEKRTVISYRKGNDPKEEWKQYSRPETAEDQHIKIRFKQLRR